MASTTPTTTPSYRRTRSKSPRSRPTTPLRASSRSSLRDSSQRGRAASASGNALEGLQDGFAELSDAMADLEQNFLQLQLMHESLARFSESFAGFLYGMNMNAFCVDFPEVCNKKAKRRRRGERYNAACLLMWELYCRLLFKNRSSDHRTSLIRVLRI